MTATATRPAAAARHWPGVVAASLTATMTVTPGFTVGALAPFIEADLHTSRTTLGLAMSLFYGATALGSPAATRVAARLPVPVVLAAAGVIAAATMIVGSQASAVPLLFAVLLVGGLSNGLVQPAAARFIAARTPTRRRSMAAGMVGAALGASTLVPGLLVAFVVTPYGWRPAMAIAGLLALVPVALVPLTKAPSEPTPVARAATDDGPPPAVGRALVLWAVAAALSAAGNNALASYFVPLGTHSGLPSEVAGKLLATSALIAIAVRLVTGALTDHVPRHNPAVIATMMLTGAVGLLLVALGSPVTFLIGAALTFSAGWGWTGLLLATAIQLLPGRAEKAGHTVQTGVYTGATIAPFGFSALASDLGFTTATVTAAAGALVAAALVVVGAVTTAPLNPSAARTPRGGSSW